MASTPSFAELLLLVFGVALFVSWVVSDVLEEQLLGRTRRHRQRAARRGSVLVRRPAPLPLARARARAVGLPSGAHARRVS